jgi:hypothetical protein
MSEITTLTEEMAQRANEFLADLAPEQKQKAQIPFADEKERRTWFYTPTPRAGLYVREMTPIQFQRAKRLLALGLSEAGYNHTVTVMGLENIVDLWSGFPDRTYGDLPGTRVRDPGNYCVAVFGTPGDSSGWSWRVGGHHVSLHYTLRNGAIAATPAFFGAEPARSVMPGGYLLRPLGAEEDYARALLGMLNPDQRSRAVISSVPPTDIVQTNRPRIEEGAINDSRGAGPGGSGLRSQLGLTDEHEEKLRFSLTPKGLRAGDMDAAQREVFTRLVRAYWEHLPDPIIAQYDERLQPGSLMAMTFAWAGPDHEGGPHYYRVQGERMLIEYDCTQNEANHTHTVLRDPEGDFGGDILAEHYAAAH